MIEDNPLNSFSVKIFTRGRWVFAAINPAQQTNLVPFISNGTYEGIAQNISREEAVRVARAHRDYDENAIVLLYNCVTQTEVTDY